MKHLEAAITPRCITSLAPLSMYASDKDGSYDSRYPETSKEGRFKNRSIHSVSACSWSPRTASPLVRADNSRVARTEVDIESVRVAAVREWQLSGALLLATALVDAEVIWLAFSKRPNEMVIGAVTVSAMSTVLGMITAAHLLASYTGSNTKWFEVRSFPTRVVAIAVY
ncbi:hypothetical protein PENSPDRAFT_313754 [Peniophora sp. CONT]|nr:hypothetical protein PENSPDRAFT_313754 [Peniophora sp. CONT]